MSIRLMARVFETNLPTTEKFVLLAMADYASESGESIFPSVETLSRKTSLDERTVQRAILSLVGKGFLDLVEPGGGRSKTNEYSINVGTLTGNKGNKRVAENPQRVAVSPERVAENPLKGGRTPPDSSLTTTTPNEPPVRVSRTAEDVKAMTRQALINHAERVKSVKKETEYFPADVVGIIGRVCELWQLSPPGRKDNRFAYWIKAARELKDACGEFGVGLIDRVHREWLDSQYMVSSPASLINTAAAAAAGERRDKSVSVAGDTTDKSYYWNSALSEEENLRLMREQKETNHDPDSEGLPQAEA